MVEYDEAPLRPFHLRIAVASTGGVFSDGFGLGIIGIALSRAAPSLALSPVWMGLLGGASLFGLFAEHCSPDRWRIASGDGRYSPTTWRFSARCRCFRA